MASTNQWPSMGKSILSRTLSHQDSSYLNRLPKKKEKGRKESLSSQSYHLHVHSINKVGLQVCYPPSRAPIGSKWGSNKYVIVARADESFSHRLMINGWTTVIIRKKCNYQCDAEATVVEFLNGGSNLEWYFTHPGDEIIEANCCRRQMLEGNNMQLYTIGINSVIYNWDQ